MTRAKLGILAATIWATGFFSVGALAFSYGGPSRATPDVVTQAVVHHRLSKDAVASPPLAKIAERVPRLAKVVVPKPPPPPMVIPAHPRPAPPVATHCTGWRDMGPGSSVRVCE